MAAVTPIEDVGELQDLVPCEEPLVAEALSGIGELRALVSSTYDIYYVEPRTPAGAVELSDLKRKVRQLGPGAERKVSLAVYDSWKGSGQARVRSKQREQEQANQFVNELIEQAVQSRASDIHINIREETAVHFRVHGMLVARQRVGAAIGLAIVASLFQHYAKTAYGAKEEARDGKFYFTSGDGQQFMVRLNKLATVDGGITCKVRLRETEDKMDLEAAGYSQRQLRAFQAMLGRGTGLLVITGAMNSGKSTTMTALLREIPRQYSVLEVSDTVEVRLDGVCHVELPADGEQLAERIAAVQDAVVRQDADYLAIGEIRNRKTATLAEAMGLQGKFVVSTGHASDAVAFYQRMVSSADFGMSVNTVLAPKFMVGLVSQALVETLCPSCAQAKPDEASVARSMHASAAEALRYYQAGLGEAAGGIRYQAPAGCDACMRTGLAGRTIVAEALPFDDDLRRIFRQGDFTQVPDWMQERRLETKHHHGLDKVLAGQVDPMHLARRIDALGPANVPNWGQP